MRSPRVAFGALAIFVSITVWIACSNDRSPSAPEPGAIEGTEGAALFEWAVGPIEGFTTVWHPTPFEFAVPVGTTIRLKCGGGNTEARWTNAIEIEHGYFGSIAEVHVAAPGRVEVKAEVEVNPGGPKGRRDPQATLVHTCVINGIDVPRGSIQVRSLHAWAQPLMISNGASNFETMQLFRVGSVAALKEIGRGKYRTSVGKLILFEPQLSDPRFRSIVEVRATGRRPQLAASELSFLEPGTYTVATSVGSTSQQVTVYTYSVEIVSSEFDRDRELGFDRVSFVARTAPPGLEREITWLSSTRSGRAEPVTGRGSSFEIILSDALDHASAPNLRSRWFGVRADNAFFVDDATCPTDECAFIASWQQELQGSNVPAGPSYVPYPGSTTTQEQVNILIEWYNDETDCGVLETLCNLLECFDDYLTDAQKDSIVDKCKTKATTVEKALCAGQEVKALFASDPNKVCKHHAVALESVLECMDIDADMVCKWHETKAHAWVQIQVDTVLYLLDSYSGIYACCQ